MPKPPTYDFVRLLKKGDISSFDKLYQKFYKKIYLFTRGILKSHDDAESVVQDVFIKIWERRKSLDENQSFESFIFTVFFGGNDESFAPRKDCKIYFDDFIISDREIN